MRIAYLSASTLPSRAANSVQVMKMCQAMAGDGHEVFLVARRGSDSTVDDFQHYGVSPCFTIVKHRQWRLPIGAEACSGLKAAGELRAIRPDLIFSRHLLSLLAASSSKVPFVFEAHAPPTRLELVIQRWLFRNSCFARLIVISGALRREFERLYPWLPKEKIKVVHDAADPPGNADVDIDLGGRTSAELKVGLIGHLYPGKGMEIVAGLAPRLPRIDFHVVGGTEEDLRHWRERVGSLENVVFHGFVAPGLTDAYRAAMDVLIAPYQQKVAVSKGGNMAFWMSPLKIFEYMAARKAIVASSLPVLKEVLTDGVDALLASPSDLSAWEAALRRLADPDLRDRLAAAAYQAFEQRYTWPKRARAALGGI